jgi:hypothetical protein
VGGMTRRDDTGQRLSDFKDEWNARELKRRTPLEIGCMIAAGAGIVGSIIAVLFII